MTPLPAGRNKKIAYKINLALNFSSYEFVYFNGRFGIYVINDRQMEKY